MSAYFPNLTGNTTYRWFSTVTLPWTPANGGVTANFSGYWLNYVSAYVLCHLDSVAVSGSQVTVSGRIWAYDGPYNAWIYYNVTAYDTLNTLFYTDKASSASGWAIESPTTVGSAIKTILP